MLSRIESRIHFEVSVSAHGSTGGPLQIRRGKYDLKYLGLPVVQQTLGKKPTFPTIF